MRILNFM